MQRTFILIVLLAGYAAMFSGNPWTAASGAFDPLDPHGRQVEQDIEAGRFGDALPVARQLITAHPDDPQILYWLAEIYRGLGQGSEEAKAWERYVRLGVAPAAACPSMPRAYLSLGDDAAALGAFERCAAFDPDDAERLIDLARAQAVSGDARKARSTYERAAAIAPDDPRITHHLANGSDDQEGD